MVGICTFFKGPEISENQNFFGTSLVVKDGTVYILFRWNHMAQTNGNHAYYFFPFLSVDILCHASEIINMFDYRALP